MQTDEKLEKFRIMLEKASMVSVDKQRSKNYFEVAGFPHYENVASSILAFFFDTNEEHGLKDLWLKSLLECYRKKFPNETIESICSLGYYETVENGITREEATQEMNRLDIVIPTNNDFVIAIENKLFATVNNPFDDYSEWINKQYNQYSDKLEILLSIVPASDDKTLRGTDKSGNTYNFINITYKELFSAVRNFVGDYIANANEKWMIYMNEFMKNIDSMQEGNMILNKEWQRFLEENNSLIGEYNTKIQRDNKAKVELVKHLANILQERFDNEAVSLSTRAYIYGTQSFAPHISLVVDITKEDGTIIALESYFKKAGSMLEDYQHLGVFYVAIWVRGKNQREKEMDSIEDVLKQKQIPYTRRTNRDWGECLDIKQFDYSKEINDKEVENYIFEIWKAIAE